MPQGYELNLRDYWNLLMKRKWIVMLSCCAIIVATGIYTSFQPFLYITTAIVKIEPAIGMGQLFQGQYYWRTFELSDYAEQFTSLPIIQEAVRRSGLISKEASPEELDNLIRAVASNISAQVIERTYMIKIELVSQRPKDAAIIVNKIIEVFRLENAEQKNQRVRNAREFVEKQLEVISVKLKESEEKLKGLALKGVGDLAGSIVSRISQLESERADLLTKFTESHPKAIKIYEQIFFLKDELEKLPKEEFEFSDLKREITISEKLYTSLREKLQEIRIQESEKVDNVILISPAITPLRPFSPNKQRNYLLSLVLGIVVGVSVGLIVEHLDTSIGRIEDLENIAKVTVIGVIPYFIEKEKEKDIKERFRITERRNIFKREIRKEDRIEKLRHQLILRHKGSSIFLEAFRILGANVQIVFGEGERMKRKCVLITSSNPQEGKSIVSANLSIIMAQMGYKTILIDGDLRRSSLHKIFGMEKKEGGLTDILAGRVTLESAVRTTTDLLLGEMSPDELLKNPWIDNIHLITSGTVFPNSLYLLNTEMADKLLKELREKYDIIIIDSSPVLAVSDTSIIVPKVDGVLFVYRAGATSRLALHRAKTQVEGVKGKGILKGIILNNVTPEVSVDSYYYYYRGKYKYYGKKEGES